MNWLESNTPRRMIIEIRKVYALSRINVELFSGKEYFGDKNSSENSLIKRMKSATVAAAKTSHRINNGLLRLVNIFSMINQASESEFALKKTHEKVTRRNVKIIFNTVLILNTNFPLFLPIPKLFSTIK